VILQIFNKLAREQVRAIVNIRLRELQDRLDENGRRIKLDIDEPAKDWLAVSNISFSPKLEAWTES
jgi:ATP-dependent Clp protease ATP-binding subunit ClpB